MLIKINTLIKDIWYYRWLWLAIIYLISPVLLYDLHDKVGFFTLTVSLLWITLLHSGSINLGRLHLLLLPLYIVVSIDLFILINFNSRLTSSYISILLGQYQHLNDFIGLWGKNIFFSVILFIAFYSFIISRLVKLNFKAVKFVRLSAILAIITVYTSVVIYQMATNKLSVSEAVSHVMAHDKNSPFGFISQSYTSYSVLALTKERRKQRTKFNFNAKLKDDNNRPELHVLILGESSRPDHWGINGYNRNTTPLLSARKNIITFDNAISEIALTKISVPLILTRETIKDKQYFSSKQPEKSILTAFKNVGYSTLWLSSVQMDHYSGEINDLALEADIQRYYERRHDEILIAGLDTLLTEQPLNKKIFIVLHTQGSHFDYKKRYPNIFNKFKQNNNHKAYITNTYDNSILYTDYIIDQVIQRLEAFNGVSTLLYVSDHGENLLDDNRKLLGHFQNNKYDLPIAMVFWGSNKFIKQYPTKYKALQKASSVNSSTTSIFPTLIDLANIEVDGTDMSLSLANENYKARTRWIMKKGEVMNYKDLPVYSQSASCYEVRQ